jgi:predicted enzyme related to lactoylglutathione lyase
MSNADIRGRFVWHELNTTDPEAAGAFYSKVVPWKAQPSALPSYTLWMAGKTAMAGLAALPSEEKASGKAPHWLLYIGTADVDATVAQAARLGARVVKPAAEVPGVGRYAVLTDPQGARFALFTPEPSPTDASPSGGPGGFSWHELATSDPDRATDFYVQLFGWQKGPAHDMGDMGPYQLIEHGGAQVGGIYKARSSTQPHWLSYVHVADADRAAEQARLAGGQILNGPMEVPGGSWIVMMLDPQGVAFAVHEPAPQQAMPAKKAVKAAKPKPLENASRAAASEQAKPAATSEPASPPPSAAARPKAPKPTSVSAALPEEQPLPASTPVTVKGLKPVLAKQAPTPNPLNGKAGKKGGAPRAKVPAKKVAPRKAAAGKRVARSPARKPAPAKRPPAARKAAASAPRGRAKSAAKGKRAMARKAVRAKK